MEEENRLNSEAPDFKSELHDMPDVFAGKSPFIFRQGMEIFREKDLKNASVDYIKQCMKSGRLNNYDLAIIQMVYKYKYLNRRMLLIMTGKKEESLKKVLRKLVGNGFLHRYYCTYPVESGETYSTPYFYGVSKGVFDWLHKTIDRGIFTVPEALPAMKTLAMNQFIIASREYRKEMTAEKFGLEVNVNNYIYRYPYSSSFAVDGVPVTFVPIVIRREGNNADIAIAAVKMMFGMIKKFGLGAVPVLICEDLLHMSAIRKAIAQDERLKDILIYYTYDLAIPGGKLFDRIYTCSSAEKDGTPVFTEKSFAFDMVS